MTHLSRSLLEIALSSIVGGITTTMTASATHDVLDQTPFKKILATPRANELHAEILSSNDNYIRLPDVVVDEIANE